MGVISGLPALLLPQFELCTNGAPGGELSRVTLPVKLQAVGSDIQKCVAAFKSWGDAVWDMMRGTWGLPPQQETGGEEEAPYKGKGHVCPMEKRR